MPTARYTGAAETDPLEAVRLHTPNVELLSGSLDPTANLFAEPVGLEQARREHRELVGAFEAAGVEVRQLHEDLAAGDALEPLFREAVTVAAGESVDLDRVLDRLEPSEQLGLALARPTLEGPATDDRPPAGAGRRERPATTVSFEAPRSNTYFQRDTSLLTDRGVAIGSMYEPVRADEPAVIEAAWEAVGADVRHVADAPLEGGDFLPAGDVALLGTSAVFDGEEHVIRTSHAAGEALLASGAVGYDEVGLVRAPLEAARAREDVDPPMIMHLLGWCNLAAEDLAVIDEGLARAATVEVYVRSGDDYRRDRRTDLYEYLIEHGYDTVDVGPEEQLATNFLTIDDGVILTVYTGDASGAYRPELNPTIETLRDRGVEVLPDGTGLYPTALLRGSGGVNCMTMPVSRR